MIRELKFADLDKIYEWCPKEYPFPDLASGLYCCQKALVIGQRLSGTALLKLTCEAVLIIDPSLGKLERARLISEAFQELKNEAIEKYGLDQVHVFILPENDEHYAEILKKHFGFQEATGIPLVLTRQ